MTSCAPEARATSALASLEVVPMTWAPRCTASCTRSYRGGGREGSEREGRVEVTAVPIADPRCAANYWPTALKLNSDPPPPPPT